MLQPICGPVVACAFFLFEVASGGGIDAFLNVTLNLEGRIRHSPETQRGGREAHRSETAECRSPERTNRGVSEKKRMAVWLGDNDLLLLHGESKAATDGHDQPGVDCAIICGSVREKKKVPKLCFRIKNTARAFDGTGDNLVIQK